MAKKKRPAAPIVQTFFGNAALQHETLLFVLVSTMDLFMTYIMLSQEGPHEGLFMESNPVARYFISGWGLRGMFYFKFGMVALICVLSQIIATHRPVAARWLLLWATAMVAFVVVYSLTLLMKHGRGPDFDFSQVQFRSPSSLA